MAFLHGDELLNAVRNSYPVPITPYSPYFRIELCTWRFEERPSIQKPFCICETVFMNLNLYWFETPDLYYELDTEFVRLNGSQSDSGLSSAKLLHRTYWEALPQADLSSGGQLGAYGGLFYAYAAALTFYYSPRKASGRKMFGPWAIAASRAANRRVLSLGNVPRKAR